MNASNPNPREQRMNISKDLIAGKCDSKCSYSMKYMESNSTAKNQGVMIQLSYDNRTNAQVIYNEQKYDVHAIMLVSPSVHLYNGKPMPAELIIEHAPTQGGNNLSVCIPIVASSETSSASVLLTDIVEKVSTSAPSRGDSTQIPFPFNLQHMVPSKPFYAYSDDKRDFIVFGDLDAIPLRSGVIETLQKIIRPFPVPMPPRELFYNSSGPQRGRKIGDGLYISCQPTGSSVEETAVEQDKSNDTSSIPIGELIQSKGFKIFLLVVFGLVFFVGLFYGIGVGYTYITGQETTAGQGSVKKSPFSIPSFKRSKN